MTYSILSGIAAASCVAAAQGTDGFPRLVFTTAAVAWMTAAILFLVWDKKK